MNNKTIHTYNKMAGEYDEETVHFWEKFPRTFLDKFIELSDEKVLDVGSGPGRDGLLLKQAGKDVVCVDASETMIELSKQKGLESVLADFNKLPFDKASFDAVWSYTALLHVPKAEIDTALGEIDRVLKPQGVFALGLIEGDSEDYRESPMMDAPRWFSYYQKEELEKIVKAHGFDTLYFESFKPGSKNYLNFIFKKK